MSISICIYICIYIYLYQYNYIYNNIYIYLYIYTYIYIYIPIYLDMYIYIYNIFELEYRVFTFQGVYKCYLFVSLLPRQVWPASSRSCS